MYNITNPLDNLKDIFSPCLKKMLFLNFCIRIYLCWLFFTIIEAACKPVSPGLLKFMTFY